MKDGLGDRRQVRLVGCLVVPGGYVEMEAVPEPGGLFALGRSQGREQLQLRARRVLGDPQRRCGVREADHEQCRGLALGEAGELGPVAVDQPVAARSPLLGVDRHTRGRERLHVAVDGAQRHLELPRQLPAGHSPAVCRSRRSDTRRLDRMPVRLNPTADKHCHGLSGMPLRLGP